MFHPLMQSIKLNCFNTRSLFVISCIVLSVGTSFFYLDSANSPHKDFFKFWLSGHMLLLQQNIYSPIEWKAAHFQYGVSWVPEPTFLYPLPLAVLYAPLGVIPVQVAYCIWGLLSQFLMATSIYIAFSLRRISVKYQHLLFALIGLTFYRPAFLTIVNGQVSGFLLFLSMLLIFLFEKERWIAGGMILPLLALKPNVGGILVLLAFFWLLRNRKYAFLPGVFLSSFILYGLGAFFRPNWIIDYPQVLSNKLSNTFGFSPTVWGLAALAGNFNRSFTVLTGGIITIFLLSFTLLVILKKRNVTPLTMISFFIIITLLITPYTWTYDQALLIIPIVAIIMKMNQMNFPFPVSAGFYLVLDLFVLALFFLSAVIQMEVLNGILPLVILGIHTRLNLFSKDEACQGNGLDIPTGSSPS